MDKEKDFKKLFNIGYSLYNEERYADAIEVFDKALEINPNDTETLFMKGVSICKIDGGFNEAHIEVFDQILRLKPDDVDMIIKLGEFFDNETYESWALDLFEEALKIDPENVLALTKKGNSLCHIGQSDQAIIYLNKALDSDPCNEFALLSKADCLHDLGNYVEAINICDDLIENNPQNKRALFVKANSLAQLGLLKESSDIFEEALQIRDNDNTYSNLKFKIQNIGPIHEANFNLGKLNIVGGINGSGKSTAAKILYSFLFSATPDIVPIIFNKLKTELLNQISSLDTYGQLYNCHSIEDIINMDAFLFDYHFITGFINNNNFESLKYFSKEFNSLVDDCEDYILEHSDDSVKSKEDFYIPSDFVDNKNSLKDYLNYVFQLELFNRFNVKTFEENYKNQKTDSEGEANLRGNINGDYFVWSYLQNENQFNVDVHLKSNYFPPILANNVFYTNPVSFLEAYEKSNEQDSKKFNKIYNFELDFHNIMFLDKLKEIPSHQYENLKSFKLQEYSLSLRKDETEEVGPEDNVANYNICPWCGREYVRQRGTLKYAICPYCRNNIKLAKIQNRIDDIIDGKFIYDNEYMPEFKYVNKNSEFGIDETSSGIQQIGIIQMLINFGELKENDFLIIDEPELSLHPDWQLKLAEIIVMLVKELGINVYINSHSPHFIEALEVFSVSYGLRDETRFFMTVPYEDTGKYDFKELSYKNVSDLYHNLGDAYERIDEIRIDNMMRGL